MIIGNNKEKFHKSLDVHVLQKNYFMRACVGVISENVSVYIHFRCALMVGLDLEIHITDNT